MFADRPPMGLPESATSHPENQEGGRRKWPTRRQRSAPRSRRCLLKGCERRFRPRQTRQRYCSEAVPEGGAGLVAVESPGEIPGHCDRQTATERAKPTLPGARQEPKITSRRAPGGARRRNTSARTRAGVRWSASGNASGTGKRHAPVERNRRAVWCPGGGNGTAS